MPNNGFMSSMPGMPNNSNMSDMMPNWNNGQIPNGRNLTISNYMKGALGALFMNFLC